MTVLEAIQRSAAFLEKRDVESPRLQVELLMAHLLKLRRMDLYLNFERALTEKEANKLREMVTRRGQREPLQHILGTACFWGLEITVNRDVLIPRPETELLAEMGMRFLNSETSNIEHRTSNTQWEEPPRHQGTKREGKRQREDGRNKEEETSSVELNEAKVPYGVLKSQIAEEGTSNIQHSTSNIERESAERRKVLDFGTGSGCLAVTLAVKCPTTEIVALDVSKAALAVARGNAERHKVESRVRFVEGDGFAALEAGERFDLIVANPPYIPSGEIASLQAEVRDFDPRQALDGGADGLDFYRRLATEAGDFLKPGGRIMMELGDGQEAAVRALFEAQKWVVEAVKGDYNGRPRILVARR